MPLRGYIIGIIILLVLLAVTTALGAGIGLAIASFSDSDSSHLIGIGIGGICGFAFGTGMCQEAIRLTKEFLHTRKRNEAPAKE